LISDDDVRAAVPERGFIARYVAYASAAKPAIPLLYHVGCAYALVSSLVTNDARISIPDLDRPTTLWVLMVGDTGTGKSSAFNVARDIYDAATDDTAPLAAISGTAQGLYTLAANLRQIDVADPDRRREVSILRFWEDDFGKTLSATKRGGGSHGEQVRAALLGLYDGQSRLEVLASKTYAVPRNRTTLLLGATAAQITRDTDASEWETGFFSRFIMLANDQPMRPLSPTMPDDELERRRQNIIRMARMLYQQTPGKNPYTGQVHPLRLTTQAARNDVFANIKARQAYEARRNYLFQTANKAGYYARGPLQRSTDAMMRAAALVMLADGRDVLAPVGQWRFTESAIEIGYNLAKLHARSTIELAERVTADPFQRLCRDVHDVVAASPVPVSQGDIHQELARLAGRVPLRKVREALEALCAEGTIFASDAYEQRSTSASGGVGTLYATSPFRYDD
jgi:hypothetical protein